MKGKHTGKDDEDFERDSEEMGVQRQHSDTRIEPFDVWPENWPSLLLFLRVRRCWRTGPLGGFLGLDRDQIESVMRMTKVKDTDAALLDLEGMEEAALEVLNA